MVAPRNSVAAPANGSPGSTARKGLGAAVSPRRASRHRFDGRCVVAVTDRVRRLLYRYAMSDEREPGQGAFAAKSSESRVMEWGLGSRFGQYLWLHTQVERVAADAMERVVGGARRTARLPVRR
jgi:hypothetical protein